MWVWLVAVDRERSVGLVTQASSAQTIERFIARGMRRCAEFRHVDRPIGRHWDGSLLSKAERVRILRGIRRNHGAAEERR